MVKADVKIKGLPGLGARIRQLQSRCRNQDPQLAVEAEYWYTTIDDGFKMAVSPEGIAWQMIADSTLAGRTRKGYGSMPLVARGDGRNSIVIRVDRNDIIFGIAPQADYMKYHQFGGGYGGAARKAKYPPRPFLPFGGTWDAPVHMGGKAAQKMAAMRKRIVKYIQTGKVQH
jgi:phage gpG-like protein